MSSYEDRERKNAEFVGAFWIFVQLLIIVTGILYIIGKVSQLIHSVN